MKDARQEILDALEVCMAISMRCAIPKGVNAVERIRAILETHTLEPIDDRPFDPTLCGFTITEDSQNVFQGHKILGEFDRVFFVKSKRSNTFTLGHAMGVAVRDCPWPATQSDGERLLKLLGVLK